MLIGYVVSKPIAVTFSSWLVTRLSHGKVRPPIGRPRCWAAARSCGIGFTVALLIATRAFTGQNLAEAKLGALSAVLVAAGLSWGVLRVTQLLRAERRARLLLGDTRLIQDLIPAVDPERDHIRGPKQALITVIECGDFECPYCGQAEPMVRDILTDTTIRYVWRHLPLTDVHPRAQLAAEASEAAAAQGAFWPMHDLLLQHRDALTMMDLRGYAESLGLDADRFGAELERHMYGPGWPRDVESADLSGCPAPRRSSSMASAATVHSTCPPSPRPSGSPASGPSPAPRRTGRPTRCTPKTSRTTPPKKSPLKIRTAEAVGAVPADEPRDRPARPRACSTPETRPWAPTWDDA